MATGARYHKFGISIERALEIYRRAKRSRHLRITGVGCHIGSQITSIEPFITAVRRLKEIFLHLRAEGVGARHLDLGGGLGIVYKDETPPPPREYARAVLAVLGNLNCTLLLEPGRVIVGNAGALITRVVLTKEMSNKNYIVVDAGMSDLMRPSLYGAYHGIQAVSRNRRGSWTADVVGPICESGDFLALDRKMPIVRADELLAIMCAGAYGFALSSNYNSRARAAEVMVRGRRAKVIRRRERFQDLVRGEALRPL
jgi:diaminopimelate decarboxylase